MEDENLPRSATLQTTRAMQSMRYTQRDTKEIRMGGKTRLEELEKMKTTYGKKRKRSRQDTEPAEGE